MKKSARLERDIEKAFLKLMRKAYPKVRTPKLRMISQRSWPDRLIPLPQAQLIFIEFKRGGKFIPTPLQEDCHEYLRGMGHTVLVTSSEHEAFELVDRELKRLGYKP